MAKKPISKASSKPSSKPSSKVTSSQSWLKQAHVLTQALPFMQLYDKKTIVHTVLIDIHERAYASGVVIGTTVILQQIVDTIVI